MLIKGRKMFKEFVFTDEDVIKFCEITRDHNLIHNPQYMRENGKKTVVPGMLILSTAIGMAGDLFRAGANMLELYFHSIIGTGEKVEIGYELQEQKPLKAEIIARNTINTLSKKGNPSMLMQMDVCPEFTSEGIMRTLDVRPNQMQQFAAMTGLIDNELGYLLFAITYASRGLLLSIDEPVTEVEREINRYLDKTINPEKISPFYQYLKIYLPSNGIKPQPNYNLDYLIHFERVKEGRTYNARVTCFQQWNLIYYSEYQLIAIPDRLIMRMASAV
ncbi:MAG: hypothetical protein PWR20_2071 [Bacteroidales bacterium]|nr:hypothetical protein [Bacteroidales bacterium]MDN5329473.1 hypothetical protein [Bacteroidales bacterium]